MCLFLAPPGNAVLCSQLKSEGDRAPGRLHTAISHTPGLVGAAAVLGGASQGGGFTGNPVGSAVV